MQTFRGKALSPGYARGRAFLLRAPGKRERLRRPIRESHVETEIARFEEALKRSAEELETLKCRVLRGIGETESGIFDAHLAMLSDPAFVDRCRRRVRDELVCVEHAVEREIRDLEAMLADVENEFIRERGHDVRDVGRRLLKNLQRDGVSSLVSPPLRKLPERSVIVAHELLPSDTVEIDRVHAVAVVTERGGPASHAVILARALGIPLVTGLTGIVAATNDGDDVLVDAVSGRVVVSPSPRQSAVFATRAGAYADVSEQAVQEETAECCTRDGVEITFLGNIGQREETEQVLRHRLRGVGLLRTECLFLNHPRPPTLRQHTSHYRYIVENLPDLPITVRTLDLGGDKLPAFLGSTAERNPIIGMRGLRYSLGEQRMFKTQLRAILRCAQSADVRVLFPMVLGVADLESAAAVLDDIMGEENAERRPRMGAMIETPAAVFDIERILELVDFISIGTNDLTQFILAADRSSTEMLGEYSVLHPAVLKAVHHVLTEAAKAAVPVTICGEAAGDPTTAALLIGLGARRLSTSPLRAARVRRLIGSLNQRLLVECAEAALASRTAVQVEKLLVDQTTGAAAEAGLAQTRYEFVQPHP